MIFRLVESALDTAKQEFGTTTNWRKAAYINTDGSMLDFSYGSNRRVDDHRTIGSVYDELDGTDAMIEYMKEGNIRLIPEMPAFDMIVEPNEIQYRVIKDLCYDFDELTIDFTNEKGYSVDSIQYDRVIPNKVVNDIKSHFSKGLAESKVRKDLKDLTGQKFGDLTVLEYDKEKSRATGQTYWKCKCSCGKETSVARKHLLNGDIKSCGHGQVQSGLDHYEDNFKGMRDRQNKYGTNLEVIRNQKMQPNNTSGVKGVDYHKGRDSWRARVRVNGKEITRWFKNKEDAVKWRKWAEQEYYQPQIDKAIQAGDLKESLELSDDYDSEGNQLTRAQAEFFKNSKIRDSQGRLLVCYHGTSAEFDTFDPEYSWDSFGFHFGTEKAAKDRDSSIIKKVYLNIENPFRIDEDLQYWDAVGFMQYFLNHEELVKDFPVLSDEWETLKHYWVEDDMYDDIDTSYWDSEFGEIFRDALYNSKYDGVIYHNYAEDAGSISYMAFYPNQIKSITNKNPSNSNSINEALWTKDGEYEPLKDSKYRRLQRKPINTLTLDDIKYLYAVHWANRNKYSYIYDDAQEAIDKLIDNDRENSYDLDMFDDCYNYLHNLKFPLTIYRATNRTEQDMGKVFGRSWTPNIDIYRNERSTFKNNSYIVACEIFPNVIDNANTIINYIHYTAKRTVGASKDSNIYGEYEITLKNNFKQDDLHNFRLVDKNGLVYYNRLGDNIKG